MTNILSEVYYPMFCGLKIEFSEVKSSYLSKNIIIMAFGA